METNYSNYREQKTKQSDEYQDFIAGKLLQHGIIAFCYKSKKYQYNYGENKAGIEIKFDNNFEKTGNLYIETAEKAHPQNEKYINSGIFRNDNTWLFAIGNYKKLYIFSKTMLKLIKQKYGEIENKTKTSKAFLLPEKKANIYAAKIIILT